MRLARREASASRVAKKLKESTGFNQKIKKSGPLTIRIRGQDSNHLIIVLFVSRQYC